ncbi:MAG: glycosyltransferase family 4 protein [Pyrinomonadaceae bacterium]
MRILIISNLYPPHFIGGYELGCHAVAERLKSRGYEIRVLTSTYGVGGASSEGEVYRWLELDGGHETTHPFGEHALALLKREARNQRAFRRAVRLSRPDLIYVWNMGQLSISLAVQAERSGRRVCYFISDRWLARWEGDPWHQLWSSRFRHRLHRGGKRVLGALFGALGIVTSSSLALPHVHFVSDFLRRDAALAGKQPVRSEVIHWGVDVAQFPYRSCSGAPAGRLLYVGQVTALKGFRTAVEALRLLVHDYGCPDVKLTVAGGSVTPDFMEEMRTLVDSHGLGKRVEFAGFIEHGNLPSVYAEHDILLFPSLFEEALTITTLEAMACGVAVVSTATGGNPEVMRHEENALTFPKGDARACAEHVRRLLSDRALFERLRANGRRTVEEGFEIEVMVDKLERSLREQVGAR